MSLQIHCPNHACQAEFERPLTDTGKIVSCPKCEAPVILPRSPGGGLAGQTIGEYQLVRPIARGGMGEVYEAIQLKLDRRVALKVLTNDLADNEMFLQRFEREAKSAAAIDHPNLVRVYDFGSADGRAFLVMELVDGEDLSRRIAREGKLSVPEALRIGEDVALALQEAHARGIIHRDIKPGNILINKKGQVKVSDLGLARRLDDDLDLTATGTSIGSPYFMSPEQASDARHVDHRADIYSLGITLLFLLTGKRPFDGQSLYAVVLAHASKPLPSGIELGVELPENVESLIQRMTAKKPESRYQAYSDLIDDIRRVRAGQPAAVPASSSEETLISSVEPALSLSASQSSPGSGIRRPKTKSRRASRSGLVLIGVGVVALAVVIGVVQKKPDPGAGTKVATDPRQPASPPERGGPNGGFRPPPEEEFGFPPGQMRPDPRGPGGPGGRMGPPNPLLPLAEIKNPLADGPIEKMYAQAKSYGDTNPTSYRSALARFEQVLAKAAGTSVEKQAQQTIAEWTRRRDAAAEQAFVTRRRLTDEALTRGEGPRSLDHLRDFPAELRYEDLDRRIYSFVLENGPRIGPPPPGREGDFPPGGKGPPPEPPRPGNP